MREFLRKVSVRHIPRTFKVENKLYKIKIDEFTYGGSILLTEISRDRFFHVSLDLRCVGWLVDQLKELLENAKQDFFRKFRGESYQVWVKKSSNKNGCFLVLTKNVHGVTKSILVPQGRDDEGWRLIKENLLAILTGEDKKLSTGSSSTQDRRGFSAVNWPHDKSYKEAVQTVGEKEKDTERVKEKADLNWSLVVVCERQKVHQTWADIRKALNCKFEKDYVLIPYQCNRAFFVCGSKAEAMKLDCLGILKMEEQPYVLLFGWERGLKNNATKIVSYGGWIVITGLPVHWWSKKFFERIGDACGGLIEIAERTKKLSYLFEAKIKVRKNVAGFLPGLIRLSEGDETSIVQIRPILPAIRALNLEKEMLLNHQVGSKENSYGRKVQKQAPKLAGFFSTDPSDGGRCTATTENKQEKLNRNCDSDPGPDTFVAGGPRSRRHVKRNYDVSVIQVNNGEQAGMTSFSFSHALEDATGSLFKYKEIGKRNILIKSDIPFIEDRVVFGNMKCPPLKSDNRSLLKDSTPVGLSEPLKPNNPCPASDVPDQVRPFLSTFQQAVFHPLGPLTQGKIIGGNNCDHPVLLSTASESFSDFSSEKKFFGKYGTQSGVSRRRRSSLSSNLQFRSVDLEHAIVADSLLSTAASGNDSDSSFCPASADSEMNKKQSPTDFTDEDEASSDDSKQPQPILNSEDGFIQQLFEDTPLPRVEPPVGIGVCTSGAAEEPMAFYHSKTHSKYRSRGVLPKMGVSLFPLKRNLFLGKSGRTGFSNGASTSVASVSSNKARKDRRDFTSHQ